MYTSNAEIIIALIKALGPVLEVIVRWLLGG